MEFSNTSNKNGLVQDTQFLCRITDATASYPIEHLTRNINQAYHNVAMMIWNCADDWQYDDSNNEDIPKVTRTMGHASADYTLPSTAQRINRVDVKDNGGDWHRVTQIDYRDIQGALEEHLSTDGLPLYYDLVGNVLELYPAPSSAYTTLASGLCLRIDRDVTQFVSSSTTASPGLPPQYHRLLSLGASLDFERDPDQRRFLLTLKRDLEDGLKKFFGTRATERRAQLRPSGKKNWRQYL